MDWKIQYDLLMDRSLPKPADRRGSLGASDAAGALGCSPWTSELELWAEKSGHIEPKDLSANDAVYFGKRFEHIVLEELERREGYPVYPWPQDRILVDPERPWMTCTPDALTVRKGVLMLVEAKTSNAYMLREWQEACPMHYQVQVQHALHVTGLPAGVVCVLIGGNSYHSFKPRYRDEDFIQTMIEAEEAFWRRVQSGDPPPPDGSESARHAINRLYPKDNKEVIELPPESATWDAELVEIKDKIKELDKEKDKLENLLRAAIGPNSVGILPSGAEYSHKLVEYEEAVRKAYKCRRLVRKGKK